MTDETIYRPRVNIEILSRKSRHTRHGCRGRPMRILCCSQALANAEKRLISGSEPIRCRTVGSEPTSAVARQPGITIGIHWHTTWHYVYGYGYKYHLNNDKDNRDI